PAALALVLVELLGTERLNAAGGRLAWAMRVCIMLTAVMVGFPNSRRAWVRSMHLPLTLLSHLCVGAWLLLQPAVASVERLQLEPAAISLWNGRPPPIGALGLSSSPVVLLFA